ncbi:MAG: tetratricopeptide repeat protein, partial [Planctomycetaceae bacterium]
QQINSELSTARALANLDEETPPDAESVERALAAVKRARSLADSEPVEDEITNSVDTLGKQVEAIGRDFALVAALEKARENEMDYRAQRANWESVQQNAIPMYQAASSDFDADREAVLFSKPNPAVFYEEAFSNWGLKLSDDENAIEKLAGRIKSLPPSIYPIVLSSLDRWRNLLKAPPHIEEWQQLEWQTLKPVQLKSLGRDRFKVLEDNSILASGPSPWSGYELSFDTDVTELNAIRLEAMLHSSLPGGGPGRSSVGAFGVDIQVDYAPLDDLENRQPLELGIGDADHRVILSEVQYGRWSSFGQIPHVAVFPCRHVAKSSSGFRIWIRSATRERNADVLLWKLGRWGRMRFSIPRANQNARTKRIAGLTTLLHRADSSDWRREMRSEMDRDDVVAAIRRASGKIDKQPNQFRVQLAEFLASRDNRDLDQLWSENVKWQPLRELQLKVKNGTVYSIDSEGIIEASGPDPLAETVSITARLPIRDVTAIRLEIIHPQEANRHLGRKLEVGLSEIELLAGSSQSATFDSIRPISIMSRRGERAFLSTRGLRLGVDGNLKAHIVFEFGEDVDQQLVIGLDPGQAAGPDVRIRVHFHGITSSRNPKRFRLSVTHDEILASKLQPAAIALLKQAVADDPSDYFSRIALSKVLSRSLVPNHAEALRHATAAVALRPQSPTAQATIIEALDLRELTKGSPATQLMMDHVERLRRLDPQHSAIDDLVRKLFDRAIQQEGSGQLAEAIETCRLAMELRSPNVASYLLLAHELANRKFYPLALAAAQTAVAVDPEDGRGHFYSGRVFEELGNHKQALRWYRTTSKVSPGLTIAYRQQADMLAKLNRHDEAIEVLKEATNRSPLEAENFDRLGDRLSDAGKPNEAIAAYRKAVEVAPSEMHYQFMLVSKLLAERQPNEAIKVYEDAIAIDPDDFLPRHNLSDLLHMLGRIDPAIEVAREVVKRHPGQSAGHSTLCRLLDMHGQPDAARGAFELGIRTCPDSAYLASGFGEFLERQGKHAAAIEQYRNAIEVDPKDTYAWNQLAALLERQGQFDAAIELFKDKITQFPAETTTHEHLARLSHRQKQFDEAVAILEDVVKLQPGNGDFLLSIASALTAHRDAKEEHVARAIELATKAITLGTQDRANAQHVLGVAQFRAGEYKTAAATLQKASNLRVEAFKKTPTTVEFGPLLAQTRCFQAMAAFQSGDVDKARQHLAEAEGGIGRLAFTDKVDLTRINR